MFQNLSECVVAVVDSYNPVPCYIPNRLDITKNEYVLIIVSTDMLISNGLMNRWMNELLDRQLNGWMRYKYLS